MIRARDPTGMSWPTRQAEIAAILARGWWRVWLSAKPVDEPPRTEPSCVRATTGPDAPASARDGDEP